jgi:hypothetical protein
MTQIAPEAMQSSTRALIACAVCLAERGAVGQQNAGCGFDMRREHDVGAPCERVAATTSSIGAYGA